MVLNLSMHCVSPLVLYKDRLGLRVLGNTFIKCHILDSMNISLLHLMMLPPNTIPRYLNQHLMDGENCAMHILTAPVSSGLLHHPSCYSSHARTEGLTCSDPP